MSTTLEWSSYGKSRVRVSKIIRRGDRHEFRELCVNVALRGEFDDAHTAGDNANVLPTDTMKNTVLAYAREHLEGAIEPFAAVLAGHFTADIAPVRTARVEIEEVLWDRAPVGGTAHRHTFVQRQGERALCAAEAGPEGTTTTSGLRDLIILKTTGSGFKGYLKDEYTTLAETSDRIMATSIAASWRYARPDVEFDVSRIAIRTALIEAFAEHQSPSVQATLYVMASAALEMCPDLVAITLRLPNLHHLPLDLSRFGVTDNREVFQPTSEPHGLIEATVSRSD